MTFARRIRANGGGLQPRRLVHEAAGADAGLGGLLARPAATVTNIGSEQQVDERLIKLAV